MKKILLINGPNLGLLGKREPEIYGHDTLASIVADLKAAAAAANFSLSDFQSDCEGAIVSRIGATIDDGTCGILLNPGAYTHTSIAIRDAVAAVRLPAVEIHLSNVHAREEFRRHSYIAPVCLGVIAGFGVDSYRLALSALVSHCNKLK